MAFARYAEASRVPEKAAVLAVAAGGGAIPTKPYAAASYFIERAARRKGR